MDTLLKSFVHILLITSCYAAPPLDEWDKVLDFGLTFTAGNRESTLVTSELDLRKKTEAHDLRIKLRYTLHEVTDNTIRDEINARFTWNWILSNDLYAGFRSVARRDDAAGIDYRSQNSATIGKYFAKGKDLTFALEAGLGYNLSSIDREDMNSTQFYLGQNFAIPITKLASIQQDFATYTDIDGGGDYNFVFNLSLKTKISDSTDVKISFQNKFESNPATNAKRNDVRVVSGLSYRF